MEGVEGAGGGEGGGGGMDGARTVREGRQGRREIGLAANVHTALRCFDRALADFQANLTLEGASAT